MDAPPQADDLTGSASRATSLNFPRMSRSRKILCAFQSRPVDRWDRVFFTRLEFVSRCSAAPTWKSRRLDSKIHSSKRNHASMERKTFELRRQTISSFNTPVLSPCRSASTPTPRNNVSHKLHRGVFLGRTIFSPSFTPAPPPATIVGQLSKV